MINRREFIAMSAGGLAALMSKSSGASSSAGRTLKSRVALVKSPDRGRGVPEAIDLLGINPVRGRDVLLKPNFNTADPFPASTHNGTLEAIIEKLRLMDAGRITIGERSGPPDTKAVMESKGMPALCKRHGVGLINFEELPEEDWVWVRPEGTNWRNGFEVARPVLDAQCVVSTCCLKTHGFGGVFTMSLKLSVGITRKRNMSELHRSPSMRKMIAEINQAYSPALVVMDGIEVFVDKGPSSGPKKRPGVILAGTDRVAMDAVGLAVLKELGSNPAIMGRGIFEQEQIARAVELGLGAPRPEAIEIVAADGEGKLYAEKLTEILLRG